MRELTLADQVVSLLDSYDSALLKEGQPSEFISHVAESLFRTVFIQVPNGEFPTSKPEYLGPDPDLHLYSMYAFSEGSVSGVYSSTSEHVILRAINIQRPAIQRRAVAQASTAA